MQTYLPFFPLNLIVFPGEQVNLHIFEPRYRQLIGDCVRDDTPFGMPVVLDGRLLEHGCLMRVVEVVQTYEDGRMDIKTVGMTAFEVLNFDNPAPKKLHAGGYVRLLETPAPEGPLNDTLPTLVANLYELIDALPHHERPLYQSYAYYIGHHVGLSQTQEYELLTMSGEAERQQYLQDHLENILPTLEAVAQTRARIRMNGSFREFGPLDL